MSYFLPLFDEYLPKMSGFRAENFTIASPMQPQQMLEISCDLHVPSEKFLRVEGRP
jgi:hypothetical protein